MRQLKRMWVNQPSTSQPLYKLHSTNVLYDEEEERIYFLSGDVISQDIPTNPLGLSKGWLSYGFK
jgi:hypothetical protein